METRKDNKAGADNGIMMGDMDGEPNGDGPKPGQPMKPPVDKHGSSGAGIQTIAEEEDDEELYMPPPPVEQAPSNRYEKRKSRALTLKFQKSRRRRPPPAPPTDEPDELYVNTPFNASASDVRINMT